MQSQRMPVFELGKNCPHDLTRYVRNDDRLSDLAWIQHLQSGAHEQATNGLLSLTSPILFPNDEEGAMGLWEKDLTLSVAKLSNKLSAGGGQRSDLIENGLTLVSAQRDLQEGNEFGDEIALKGNDLLHLAVEKINSAKDLEEIGKFGICGLAVASAVDDEANAAASIWHAVIRADIQTWKEIARDNDTMVGGMSEEELIQRVEGTAFVGLMCDFATASKAGDDNMQAVGFGSDQVRGHVFHSLGSDELTKVLTLSAKIVHESDADGAN